MSRMTKYAVIRAVVVLSLRVSRKRNLVYILIDELSVFVKSVVVLVPVAWESVSLPEKDRLLAREDSS